MEDPLKILYAAIDELSQSGNEKFQLEKSKDSPLFGQGAKLSSLDLVKFVVLVEEKIEGATGQGIRVLTDKAMSRKSSPFKTLGTFADYITELIAESNNER